MCIAAAPRPFGCHVSSIQFMERGACHVVAPQRSKYSFALLKTFWTMPYNLNSKMLKAVVIGVSAGGMDALTKILPVLPADFPLPVIVVQHLHPEQGRNL
ncbi:MAG: hypothetical protein GY801_14075 [bacterium]|nr:hypothetical protein [bacterium]